MPIIGVSVSVGVGVGEIIASSLSIYYTGLLFHFVRLLLQ